jgi:hypothetical protein
LVPDFVEPGSKLSPTEPKIALKTTERRVPIPDQPPVSVDGHWLTPVLAIHQEGVVVDLDSLIALLLYHPTNMSARKWASGGMPRFADALHETRTVIRTAPHGYRP